MSSGIGQATVTLRPKTIAQDGNGTHRPSVLIQGLSIALFSFLLRVFRLDHVERIDKIVRFHVSQGHR